MAFAVSADRSRVDQPPSLSPFPLGCRPGELTGRQYPGCFWPGSLVACGSPNSNLLTFLQGLIYN